MRSWQISVHVLGPFLLGCPPAVPGVDDDCLEESPPPMTAPLRRRLWQVLARAAEGGSIVNTQGEMAPEKKAAKSSKAGPELARGIGREGRSKTYKRRGLWAIKKKNGGKFPVHEKKEKPAEPEGKVWPLST